MPAHINYETTPIIFYKFVCEDHEIKSCYVGHTTNFMGRRRQHKYCCTNKNSTEYELKKYKIIRENGGWDKWKMVEVHRQICLDKIDCIKIEQKYIEELQTDMNMKNAYHNREEYEKKYKLENAEKIATYVKQHRLENKEHYQEYKKKYVLKNKEHVSEQSKIYRLNNIEKISARAVEKFNCECGGKYIYSTKSAHLKTLKHLKYCETI
jgi:hypothetical protein